MSWMEEILRRAALAPRRIALPEAGDSRILQAAARLQAEGIAVPVLIGAPSAVHRAAREASVDLAGVELLDPAACDRGDGMPRGADRARRAPVRPLDAAAALLKLSRVDGLLAGAVHSTAETLDAILRAVGPAPDKPDVSSFFLMDLARPTPAGEATLAFADCRLVASPTSGELARIAVRTAERFALLTGRRPRVALLSFSTKGSAEHERVVRVRRAVGEINRLDPSLEVDGELQGDAALNPEVAAAKAPGSAVAGSANVLIFPDLAAADIARRLAGRLAHARAVGPLLSGLSAAANLLPRDSTVDEIVVAAAVTAVQAS